MDKKQLQAVSVLHITTVTEPSFDGQRVCGAIVEYDRVLDSSQIDKDMFAFTEAPILDCYVSDKPDMNAEKTDGNYVIFRLSSEDESSRLMQKIYNQNRGPKGGPGGSGGSGGPGAGGRRFMSMKKKDTRLHLIQKRALPAADGSEIAPPEGMVLGDREVDLIVNRFQAGEFHGMKYNLFIPQDYDETKKYPMLLFIPDATGNGPEQDRTLIQGMGATIWATDAEQKKHPCFIVAPQIDGEPLTRNDYTCSPQLEIIKELLDSLQEAYCIDADRIYTTGQSQGCMASFELNIRYPDYFAAALLVSGHWDAERIAGTLSEKKLLIALSEGGIGEFNSMSKLYDLLTEQGANVEKKFFNARAEKEELNAEIADYLSRDANIKMVIYTKESSLPDDGKTYPGIMYHQRGWEITYPIEAVRDWLFKQKK